jgi:hypothetical protein
MPHPVTRIYVPSELPSIVVVTSSDASVNILDQDLRTVASSSSASSSTASEHVVKTFLFVREVCSYASDIAPTNAMYLAVVLSKGSDLFLRVHGITEQSCPALGEIRIPDVDSVSLRSLSDENYIDSNW